MRNIFITGIVLMILLTGAFAVSAQLETRYVETADEQQCDDAFCDGNPSTCIYEGMSEYYFNYSKEEGDVNFIWQITADIEGTFNVTIPDDCKNINPDKILLRAYHYGGEGQSGFECYNGSESQYYPIWKELNRENFMICEEGLFIQKEIETLVAEIDKKDVVTNKDIYELQKLELRMLEKTKSQIDEIREEIDNQY